MAPRLMMIAVGLFASVSLAGQRPTTVRPSAVASPGDKVFVAVLTGPHESPTNASPGTGVATVTFNSTAHTMRVQASFSGLLGTTTAAHIHAATALPFTSTAGVATTVPSFPGFPLGVTSGTYDQTFDTTQASSYNPAFVAASGSVSNAEAALFASIANETAYFNIHTSVFGGGEIRGFLTVAFTDEPPLPGTTVIAAAHVNELRARINGQRRRYLLGDYAWIDAPLTPGVSVITAQQIVEMRTALEAAYTAASLPLPTWTDPALAPGHTILLVHLSQLRAAVAALEG